MELENFKKVINILVESDVKQITLSGGEPTTYPYIKDAIKFAYDHGLIVHMNTNGFLLTRKLAKDLKDKGLSQVQTNIDSLTSETHDQVRGKKGSFQRAIQALKNAREAGLTCVSQTVLTKNNENEILDIFKFARSLGLQRCRVWDMTPSEGCAKENRELLPTDYLATLQMLADFAYETGAQTVESGDPLFPLDSVLPLSVSGGEYCAAAKGMFTTISCKGDIFYCATQRKSMYNIWEDLNGYLLGEYHKVKVKEYLQAYQNPEECNYCKFSKTCNGGCLTRGKFSKDNTDYWCPKSTELTSLSNSTQDMKPISNEIIKIVT